MGVPAARSPGIQRNKLPRNKWLHIFTHTLANTHTHTSLPERRVWDNQRGFTAVSNLLFPHPFLFISWAFYTHIHVHLLSSCMRTHLDYELHLKKRSIKYLIFHQMLTKASHQDKSLLLTTVQKGPGSYYSSAERLAQSIDFLLLDCSLSVKPAHTHTVGVREMGRETWELYEGQQRTIEPPRGKGIVCERGPGIDQ